MVRGLDTFATFFAGHEAQYVLIGGVATLLALDEAGLDFRATKDLDIVLCVEALTPDFGHRMWDFIAAGGYEIQQQGPEPRRFYRFIKPADDSFPVMLEFFAREPGHLPLAEGSHLTPVPIDGSVESLSAILLDDDYYQFIHAHKQLRHGMHIVSEQCLIPLKARAWLDLNQRKTEGNDTVDSKHIRKHRGDVLRLAQLLTPGDAVDVPESIAADMRRFLDAVAPEIDANLMRSLGTGMKPAEVLELLRAAFGRQP